ncbi:hypothetical protein BDQ17DRAFT_141203 [Cyathus striatus]|nr:hypothetical protein BDQ17DRAFT_141203 [Cyathus striatus]
MQVLISRIIHTHPRTLDLSLQGIWIVDSMLSWDVVQELIPTSDFVHKYEHAFAFNQSFLAHLDDTAEKCQYTNYVSTHVTFPPKTRLRPRQHLSPRSCPARCRIGSTIKTCICVGGGLGLCTVCCVWIDGGGVLRCFRRWASAGLATVGAAVGGHDGRMRCQYFRCPCALVEAVYAMSSWSHPGFQPFLPLLRSSCGVVLPFGPSLSWDCGCAAIYAIVARWSCASSRPPSFVVCAWLGIRWDCCGWTGLCFVSITSVFLTVSTCLIRYVVLCLGLSLFPPFSYFRPSFLHSL